MSDRSSGGSKHNPRSHRPHSFDYPTLRRQYVRGWLSATHGVPEADPPPIHFTPEDIVPDVLAATDTDHGGGDSA